MRWVRRVVTALLIGLLAGSLYAGWCVVQSRRPVVLPALGGGDPVGRRTVEWVEAGHTDPLAPRSAPRRDRELPVWLWYPAEAAGRHPSAYAPDGWAAIHLPGAVGLGETSFGAIRTRATDDAPPRHGAHSLVVLAPGLGFSAVQYQALAETIAAQGYVVAAFTPTYSANVAVLHGQVFQASVRGGLPDDLTTASAQVAERRLLATWVDDAQFVARQTRRTLPLRRGVVYVGHSFGGATALQACHEDRTCLGAANLDGLDGGTVRRSGLAVPVLLLGHENSCVTGLCRPAATADRHDAAIARRLVEAGGGAAWSVELDGTEHFDFTDYAAYRIAWPLRDLLPLGSRSGPGTVRTVERCVLDLVSRATKDDRRWGCLDGSLPHTEVRTW